MTLQVTIRTVRRTVPGAPVSTTHKIIAIEAPEIEEAIRGGGHNEDGTFEYRDVVEVSITSGQGK